MKHLSQEKLEELYKQIQAKASEDKDFAKALLEDPNETIEKYFDVKIPEGSKIKVIQNDPSSMATLVMPDMLGEEIEVDDLDNVSGGVVSFLLILSACAAAITILGCAADVCAANVCAQKSFCGAETCGAEGDLCGGNAQ